MRKEQATSEIKTSAAGDGGPEHLLTRRGALRRINKHLLLFGRFKGRVSDWTVIPELCSYILLKKS